MSWGTIRDRHTAGGIEDTAEIPVVTSPATAPPANPEAAHQAPVTTSARRSRTLWIVLALGVIGILLLTVAVAALQVRYNRSVATAESRIQGLAIEATAINDEWETVKVKHKTTDPEWSAARAATRERLVVLRDNTVLVQVYAQGLSPVRFLSDASHRDLVANTGRLVTHAEGMIDGLDAEFESATRRTAWRDYVSVADQILSQSASPQTLRTGSLP